MEAWIIEWLEKLKEVEERPRLYIEEELPVESDPTLEVDTHLEDPTLVDFEVNFSI